MALTPAQGDPLLKRDENIIVAVVAAAMVAPVFNPRVTIEFMLAVLSAQLSSAQPSAAAQRVQTRSNTLRQAQTSNTGARPRGQNVRAPFEWTDSMSELADIRLFFLGVAGGTALA
jgi:hypothetical protein